MRSYSLLFVISIIVLFNLSLAAQNNSIIDSLKTNLKLAEESGDSLEISRANYKLGKYLSYVDISESYSYLETALEINKNLKYAKAVGIISNLIASNYSDEGMHQKAIDLFYKTKSYFDEAGLYNLSAPVLMNIGSEYAVIGEYDKAIEIEFKALETLIESGDSSNIANYYCEIGKLFDIVGNIEKYEELIVKASELIDNELYANIYTRYNVQNELGFILESKGKLEEAYLIYKNLYEESKENNYTNGTYVGLKNMAIIKKKSGNYKKALELLNKGLKVLDGNDLLGGTISCYSSIGEIYYLLGDNKSAKENLNKAILLAEKNRYSEQLKLAHKILFDVYNKAGDYKSAVIHLRAYSTIKDSLESLAVKEQFAEMETKFETKQKEKQIEYLNIENELNQNEIKSQFYFFSALISFVVLGSLLGFVYTRNKKVKVELEAIKAHQNLLRTQLNPHFVFNSLNAIQNYVLTNKSLESADYLSDFASLMRLILEGSREEFVSLQNEIKLINYYLNLQTLRFNHSFKYNIEVNNSIDLENTRMPFMLLQPFIENAVEHGIKGLENRTITISIEFQVSKLNIIVTDDGRGFDQSKESGANHTSYAIKITKERIENLKKLNGLEIQLNIDSKIDNGTKIEFVIPVQGLKLV